MGSFIRVLKVMSEAKKQSELRDRGLDLANNITSREGYEKAVRKIFMEESIHNAVSFFSLSGSRLIISQAALLLDYALCARGQLVRIIRLSDCFIYHMENPRGARKIYPVLCFGFKVSKRNAFQRVEHAGCVRHLDPSLCPVGYTAYQVVHMFLSNPALIPDMSKDRTW